MPSGEGKQFISSHPAADLYESPRSSAGGSLGVCAQQGELPALELCPQVPLRLAKSAPRDSFHCNAPQPSTRRVWRLGPNSWGGATVLVEVSGKTSVAAAPTVRVPAAQTSSYRSAREAAARTFPGAVPCQPAITQSWIPELGAHGGLHRVARRGSCEPA
ncbi:uncharacterized protein LOC116550261 [Sapajus apella]|uniref:Uncharacterized protein LOC116550261 n=1 Tax=Sapajus apella TaxID=9515 RepID=A0A6J3HNE7_SAPAP|nr:uncharacterized protein LOC116550261 [Sapajus apella]